MSVPNLNAEAQQYLRDIQSNWKIRAYFLKNLPTAWWWGLRVKSINGHRCEVTIPYCWRTQNPFRSIYFAALAGAGELSTGVLANLSRLGKGSISMLVTEQRMEFVKKASTTITFTCEDGEKVLKAVDEAVTTGTPQKVRMKSTGKNTSGEVVAHFEIEWSFKKRAR
jgi:hypothetical protein